MSTWTHSARLDLFASKLMVFGDLCLKTMAFYRLYTRYIITWWLRTDIKGHKLCTAAVFHYHFVAEKVNFAWQRISFNSQCVQNIPILISVCPSFFHLPSKAICLLRYIACHYFYLVISPADSSDIETMFVQITLLG